MSAADRATSRSVADRHRRRHARAGHAQRSRRRAAASCRRTPSCSVIGKPRQPRRCGAESDRQGALHLRRAAARACCTHAHREQHRAARPHQVDRHVGGGGVSRRASAVHILDRVLSIAQLRDPERGSERALPARALQRPADCGCRRRDRMRAAEGRREARAHRIRAPAARHDARSRRCATTRRSCSRDRRSKPRRPAAAAPPPGLPQQGNLRGPDTRRPRSAGRAATCSRASRRPIIVVDARIPHAGADAHADGDARPGGGLARGGA